MYKEEDGRTERGEPLHRSFNGNYDRSKSSSSHIVFVNRFVGMEYTIHVHRMQYSVYVVIVNIVREVSNKRRGVGYKKDEG